MTKDEVVAAIEADIKKKGKSRIISEILFIIFGWIVFGIIYVNAPIGWFLYLLAAIFILLPLGSFLYYQFVQKPANAVISKSILTILYVNPSSIAWVYEKKTSRNGRLSYSILICDNQRHCYETRSVKNAALQGDLLKSLVSLCPLAIAGYRADWQPLYYRNPTNFRSSVMAYEEQFKRR